MEDLHDSYKWTAPDVTENMPFNSGASDRLTPDAHKKLVMHLLRLLHLGEEDRTTRNGWMEAIEVDLLGSVEPTGSDCERKQKRMEKKDVSVPDAIYPFGWIELQKFASEILSVVMPIEAPYSVVASADKQQFATAMTKALRHQAAMFDHRNNAHAAIFDTVALDCGAMEFSWDTIATAGVSVSLAGTGSANPTDFRGPRVTALDPYNISWDPACPQEDLVLRGEYFAHFDLITPFELDRLTGAKNFLPGKLQEQLCKRSKDFGIRSWAMAYEHGADFKNYFYYSPKVSVTRDEILRDYGTNRKEIRQTDHSGTFLQRGRMTSITGQTRLHRTVMYVRLKPSKWGLVTRLTREAARMEQYQVWEIHLVGEGYICYAAPAIYGIDRMPIALASMNYRRHPDRSFRAGDHAAQIGLFASTIMNLHKRSLRKGLEGGLTVYNPQVFDFKGLEQNGTGRIAARMQRYDDDVRRHIAQLNDTPDYKNTMNDVRSVAGLLQEFFPSNSQPAMMGLDRATQYQAQAVMLTSMRSILFYAALVDGQMTGPMRFAMHHLNLLNSQDLRYVDEARRELITVNATDIENAEFELVQSQPLMGIDRLRVGNVLRDVVNITLQAGGELPPVPAMLLRHFIQTESTTITMEEYEKAVAEQQAQAEQRALMEAQNGAPGGGSGAAAQAQAASMAPGTPAVV